jgi:hypothetical protein
VNNGKSQLVKITIPENAIAKATFDSYCTINSKLNKYLKSNWPIVRAEFGARSAKFNGKFKPILNGKALLSLFNNVVGTMYGCKLVSTKSKKKKDRDTILYYQMTHKYLNVVFFTQEESDNAKKGKRKTPYTIIKKRLGVVPLIPTAAEVVQLANKTLGLNDKKQVNDYLDNNIEIEIEAEDFADMMLEDLVGEIEVISDNDEPINEPINKPIDDKKNELSMAPAND